MTTSTGTARLDSTRRHAAELADSLDDGIGPLDSLQHVQLMSARNHLAALVAVLDQMDLATRGGR